MPDEITVIPKTGDSLERVNELREQISLTLKQYDSTITDPKSRKLFDVFDACIRFQNVNDMLLTNVSQLEAMLQGFFNDFLEERQRVRKELVELEKHRDTDEFYESKRRGLCNYLTNFNAIVNQTTRTILMASKERRMAIYQSKYVYEAVKVQQMLAIIFSVISRNVHDPAIVAKIMQEFKIFSKVLQVPGEITSGEKETE
ncbi:MAG: hypothetical protein Q7J98_04050 [Kiritimatiellia bacterium]|nr:hypothetical protein [Kiritimatiellia bacterium]